MLKRLTLFFLFFRLISLEMHGETVVGVHGFLATCKPLLPAKSTLIRCGLDVFLWEYPTRKRCIEDHGSVLAHYLQAIACKAPGEPIHFVTHSVGALVVRSALNMPHCPPEAKMGRAVLLAPPNQGSQLARQMRKILPIKLCMGKRLGAQLMNYDPCEIAEAFGEFPSTMDVLVITGTRGNRLWFDETNDGFLSVEETWLNTPFYYLEYPLTHGTITKIPKVLRHMRTFIRSGPDETVLKKIPEPVETDSGKGIILADPNV